MSHARYVRSARRLVQSSLAMAIECLAFICGYGCLVTGMCLTYVREQHCSPQACAGALGGTLSDVYGQPRAPLLGGVVIDVSLSPIAPFRSSVCPWCRQRHFTWTGHQSLRYYDQ